MGDVFDVYASDPDTGELLAIIADSDSVELANNQTTFYATGKAGVRMKGFDREKTSTLSGQNGTILDGLLGIQTGTLVEAVTNVTTVKLPVPLTSTTTSVVLPYPVTGTAGSEIGYLYALNTDGSIKKKYAQAASASATEFTYASATKTITLPTGATDKKWLVMVYPTISTAKKIANDSNTFSKHAEIGAKVRLDEVCGDTSYIGYLHMPLAKFSGEWSLATGTEAAVHAWSCEAMAGCGSKLWDLYIFNEDDIASE
jgi:hypothetical protein